MIYIASLNDTWTKTYHAKAIMSSLYYLVGIRGKKKQFKKLGDFNTFKDLADKWDYLDLKKFMNTNKITTEDLNNNYFMPIAEHNDYLNLSYIIILIKHVDYFKEIIIEKIDRFSELFSDAINKEDLDQLKINITDSNDIEEILTILLDINNEKFAEFMGLINDYYEVFNDMNNYLAYIFNK